MAAREGGQVLIPEGLRKLAGGVSHRTLPEIGIPPRQGRQNGDFPFMVSRFRHPAGVPDPLKPPSGGSRHRLISVGPPGR